MGTFGATTLAAVLVAAATGCGTPRDAADSGVVSDATSDGGAPGFDGSACVAAGGYCTSEPFCGVAIGPQPCGPTMNRAQYVLYGKNLPLMTMRTRSPFGSGSRAMSMEKSMALMMPSPNSSWMSALSVVP